MSQIKHSPKRILGRYKKLFYHLRYEITLISLELEHIKKKIALMYITVNNKNLF